MGLFKPIVVPVLVALLLTVLLRPISQFMVRKGRLPNTLATAITVLGLIAVVAERLAGAGRGTVTAVGARRGRAAAGCGETRRGVAGGTARPTIERRRQ